MPNTHLPDAAQACVCGNVEDIKSVACEGSSAVEMTMTTATLTSIQTNADMSGST